MAEAPPGQILEKESTNVKHKMLPVHEENGVYNFYMRMGSKGAVAPLEEKKLEELTKSELLRLVRDLQSKAVASAGSSGGLRQPPA